MFLLQLVWAHKETLQKICSIKALSKCADTSSRFNFTRPKYRETATRDVRGMLKEEQLPHFQAATSSTRIVCSTMACIHNQPYEALLDSGSMYNFIN